MSDPCTNLTWIEAFLITSDHINLYMARYIFRSSFLQVRSGIILFKAPLKSHFNKHILAFCKNKMEEKMSRFAVLEGIIDDFTGKQEKKNMRAKIDRDVSLLKGRAQKHLLNSMNSLTVAIATCKQKSLVHTLKSVE